MAPFIGRVFEGTVRWGGRTARLPLTNGRQAIHGAVFDVPWEVAAQTPQSVTLACAFDPARWPLRDSMRQRVAIVSGRLTLEAEILAQEPMPAAIGWHPWFRSDGADLRVGVQSDSVLRLAPDLIPTGELLPVDGRTDLRARPGLAGLRLDDVFVSVTSPVVVDWPDLELTLAFEQPVRAVVVYSHPQGVCVEPATAWPDSIRLAAAGRNDTGLVSRGRRTAASVDELVVDGPARRRFRRPAFFCQLRPFPLPTRSVPRERCRPRRVADRHSALGRSSPCGRGFDETAKCASAELCQASCGVRLNNLGETCVSIGAAPIRADRAARTSRSRNRQRSLTSTRYSAVDAGVVSRVH